MWRNSNSRIVAAVTPEMLSSVWDEIEYRLDICGITEGAHVEIYKQKLFEMNLFSVFNVVQYLFWLINCIPTKSWIH
jgi:hypothetical protein